MDLSKSILITGASGYIGSHLLHELITAWASDIYCLSSSWKKSDTSPYWIECDITNRTKVFEIFQKIKPRYIFHCAALWAKTTQVTFSLENFLRVNAFGTQNLVDAAIESNICEGFLNISTAYEYGPKGYPISENTDFSPQGNYAISKAVWSMYLDQKIHSLWFPWITYRLFSVYGPNDIWRIIPLITDALTLGKELHLFDIHRKRDFVYIDTVISLALKFDKIRKNNINSLNIWSWESLSVYELVAKLSQILNRPILNNIIFDESSIPNAHWECNNALLKQYIDPILLNDGLLKALKH